MPNGGPDNCANCRFRSNPDRAWQLGNSLECTIRKVAIPVPLWTYCANIHTGNSTPAGPIFIAGLEEFGARPIGEDKLKVITPFGAAYVRIPCHGDTFPRLGASGVCCVCDRSFQIGIGLTRGKEGHLVFCCNKHYLDWWEKNHPGEELRWKYQLHDPAVVQSASAAKGHREASQKRFFWKRLFHHRGD